MSLIEDRLTDELKKNKWVTGENRDRLIPERLIIEAISTIRTLRRIQQKGICDNGRDLDNPIP